MADQTNEDRTVDQVKTWAPLGFAVLAVAVFYMFPDMSLLVRSVALVVLVSVGIAVFFTSDKGRELAFFLKNARVELRKMIWPTRPETAQTTLIVLAAVIIIALFLWAIDMFLRWFMAMVIR